MYYNQCNPEMKKISDFLLEYPALLHEVIHLVWTVGWRLHAPATINHLHDFIPFHPLCITSISPIPINSRFPQCSSTPFTGVAAILLVLKVLPISELI